MKKTLLFLGAFACGIIQVNAQANCSEIFFSEYVEGTGNDKALELYNPTSSTINLSGYRIERFSNGASTSSSGGVLNLSGSIAPYSAFVVTNGQTVTTGGGSSPMCNPTLQAMADLLDGAYPAPTYMNGNDAMALYHNTTMIDLIGKIGDGSMTAANGWGDESPYDGSVGKTWTENHTLIRKSSVSKGVSANPDPFIVSTEWDSLPKDTWSNLGSHTCGCFVGLDELKSNVTFAVYPNPSVNGVVQIVSSAVISKIEIINLLGEVVLKDEISNLNVTARSIDHSKLENGLYTVRIQYVDNSMSIANFVIQ